MILSGEEIRQEAETRERTCPKGMKGSFYYGFREGAKWVDHIASEQKEYDEDSFHAIIEENVLKAIEKQKAIDIDKICKVYCNNMCYHSYEGSCTLEIDKDECIRLTRIRKAMEE